MLNVVVVIFTAPLFIFLNKYIFERDEINLGIKIAHCADIHIGTSVLSLENKCYERRNEIKNSFSKIVKKCETEKVQVLCVAGDLFDDTNVTEADVEEVKNVCKKAPFKIIIV